MYLLHMSAKAAFPQTMPSSKAPCNTDPQNGWYDDECRELRTRQQQEITLGTHTHKQVRTLFKCLVRKKKQDYLARFEKELCQFILGQDNKKAWSNNE